MIYLVTVKLPRNPNHDPRNKKTGPCPVFGGTCTDVTGEHHTGALVADTLEDAQKILDGNLHITRIEEVTL
jgi:hypothetical protein